VTQILTWRTVGTFRNANAMMLITRDKSLHWGSYSENKEQAIVNKLLALLKSLVLLLRTFAYVRLICLSMHSHINVFIGLEELH